MEKKLGLWIEDNAELFRYLSDVKSLCENAERILLSGKVSGYFGSLFQLLYHSVEIDSVDNDIDVLKDADSSEAFNIIEASFDRYIKLDAYDAVISALAIQSLNTRELTPYLFNLYDSLKTGGVLYLSFPDAVAPTVMEKNLYPAWYDEGEMIPMKYYMAGDVANALEHIGFEIKALEADNNNDLLHVVTIIGIKK